MNYWNSLPYDLFVMIIEIGKIKGKDLIRFASTCNNINEKCNYKNQYLFKRLLKNDYHIDYNIGYKEKILTPRDYYIQKNKKRRRAVVHLISSKKVGYEQYSLPTMDQLEKTYPGITMQLVRGDIVQDIDSDGAGYRSQGSCLFNGDHLINTGGEIDDYGNVPEEFKVITEFPPDYWQTCCGSPTLPVIRHEAAPNWNNNGIHFYWHSDEVPVSIDLKILNENSKIVEDEGNKYYLMSWNNKIHIIYADRDLKECSYVVEEYKPSKESLSDIFKIPIDNIGYVLTTILW